MRDGHGAGHGRHAPRAGGETPPLFLSAERTSTPRGPIRPSGRHIVLAGPSQSAASPVLHYCQPGPASTGVGRHSATLLSAPPGPLSGVRWRSSRPVLGGRFVFSRPAVMLVNELIESRASDAIARLRATRQQRGQLPCPDPAPYGVHRHGSWSTFVMSAQMATPWATADRRGTQDSPTNRACRWRYPTRQGVQRLPDHELWPRAECASSNLAPYTQPQHIWKRNLPGLGSSCGTCDVRSSWSRPRQMEVRDTTAVRASRHLHSTGSAAGLRR
jgi:hypothetical protein